MRNVSEMPRVGKCIFIVWSDMTGLRETGQMVRRDANWFPEFETVAEGKAALWKLDGSPEDISAAEKFARSEGRQVFATSEANYDRARAMAISAGLKAGAE